MQINLTLIRKFLLSHYMENLGYSRPAISDCKPLDTVEEITKISQCIQIAGVIHIPI